MKIKSARIKKMPKDLYDTMPQVFVTFENGEEEFLFEYYPDEISFTVEEFIGFTKDEARDLRRQKDYKFLTS